MKTLKEYLQGKANRIEDTDEIYTISIPAEFWGQNDLDMQCIPDYDYDKKILGELVGVRVKRTLMGEEGIITRQEKIKLSFPKIERRKKKMQKHFQKIANKIEAESQIYYIPVPEKFWAKDEYEKATCLPCGGMNGEVIGVAIQHACSKEIEGEEGVFTWNEYIELSFPNLKEEE